ncbi:gp34.61 [Bacillus phage SPO1]|uniref:Gp34.61 n=1 Tax=Bacillus phage SP01 TaxID=2884427 RepID=B6V307_BPSP1|nr:gp34.61 [Bacillus phage SPO1]ACI91089.1 gp34.61 [Bacillus phage SPO1]
MESIICPACGESELELWHMGIYECPKCGNMIPREVWEDEEYGE